MPAIFYLKINFEISLIADMAYTDPSFPEEFGC